MNCIKKRYEINEESLFGTILFKTGGIIIENWLRLYGAGALDFNKRNDLFPESNIIVAEDVLGGLFVMQDDSNISYSSNFNLGSIFKRYKEKEYYKK